MSDGKRLDRKPFRGYSSHGFLFCSENYTAHRRKSFRKKCKKSGKGGEGEWVLRQEECLAAVQADPGIACHYGTSFMQGVPEDVEIARQERLTREELVDIGPYGAPRFNISAA